MGRPTKLSPEVEKKVTNCLKMGNYIETCAAFAGISTSTYYNWINRGKKELQRNNKFSGNKIRQSEKPFVEFKIKVDQALAEAEMRALQIIMIAARKDWKAAAWKLERRYYDKWWKKSRHEITGQGGGPLEFKSYKESLQKKIKAMVERNGSYEAKSPK